MRVYHYLWMMLMCMSVPLCTSAQMIWKEPPPANLDSWKWGPGGEQSAPRPPFQFIREKRTGTNPKVVVEDSKGRLWTVKFGSEVYADTFAPRILNALGYAAEPTFFVPGGRIGGVHDLKRAKHFISKTGAFRNASFKLHRRGAGPEDERAWSWTSNPFVGSRQLAGLKILVMLISNWDTKDARDGNGSNNKFLHASSVDGLTAWYAVTDWGASLGKCGSFLHRDRWDLSGYAAQTPSFVRLTRKGEIHWDFDGKHRQDITAGIGLDDIRWFVPYLSRISDDELLTGLEASGAAIPIAQGFTRMIRKRIGELQQIANSRLIQRAGK